MQGEEGFAQVGKGTGREGRVGEAGADGADTGAHPELTGELEDLDELRVDGRLAARKVHGLHPALRLFPEHAGHAAEGDGEGRVVGHAGLFGAEGAPLRAVVGDVEFEPAHGLAGDRVDPRRRAHAWARRARRAK